MTTDERYAQYHQQLDALEKRLKDTTKQLEAPALGPGERERAALHDKAAAFRSRLEESELSAWETIKHELASEWQGLTQAFDRWTSRVDSHFKDQ